MKTVVWDSYGLDNPHSGIGRHGCKLLSKMSRLGSMPLVLRSKPDFLSANSSLYVSGKLPSKIGYSLFLRKAKAQIEGSGQDLVFHGLSNFNIPRKASFKTVLTVHDLIPLLQPSNVSLTQSLQCKFLIPRALASADAVICVSAWTKQTIQDLFPNYASKCVVIPNGRDSQNSIVSRETSSIKLLTVSRYESYKGFDTIIRLVSKLDQEISLDFVTDERGKAYLEENGRDLLSAGRIRIHLSLSDESLNSLFLTSDILLHASQLEGYCLPASEALARGLPVVYQSGSGVDEVVGNGGVGIKAGESIDQWVDTVRQVFSELGPWRGRAEEAFRRLDTWDEVAKKTLSVYNN